MNRTASAILCGTAVLASLPAQVQPTGRQPQWLVGLRVVAARSGQVLHEPLPPEDYRGAQTLRTAADQYFVNGYAVDLARAEVLESNGRAFWLRTFTGRELWQAELKAIHNSQFNWPRLARDRVVFAAASGGLIALDRATGEEAWRRSEGPNEVVDVADDLVVAADAGRREHGARLVGFAVANGSRAFEVALPGPARRIVAASHGIAALGRDYVVVHARFGPELFRIDGHVAQLVASPGGWLLSSKGHVRALDRNGRLLWQKPLPSDGLGCFQFVPASDGSVLVVRHSGFADSGFAIECRAPEDGSLRWSHREPGLGVDHSRYRHAVDVQCVDDSVLVLSDGTGGAFVVELALGAGGRRARNDIE